jgi:hypothetical protein
MNDETKEKDHAEFDEAWDRFIQADELEAKKQEILSIPCTSQTELERRDQRIAGIEAEIAKLTRLKKKPRPVDIQALADAIGRDLRKKYPQRRIVKKEVIFKIRQSSQGALQIM